jgi:hypothetical protein
MSRYYQDNAIYDRMLPQSHEVRRSQAILISALISSHEIDGAGTHAVLRGVSGGPDYVFTFPLEGVRVLAARQKDAIRRQGTCDAQYRNRLPMILNRSYVGRGTSRSALPSSLVASRCRCVASTERSEPR